MPVVVGGAGVCGLAAVTGPCRASIIRWHFDSAAERCETFVYGGCSGNENNFSDELSCSLFCTGHLLPAMSKTVKSHVGGGGG